MLQIKCHSIVVVGVVCVCPIPQHERFLGFVKGVEEVLEEWS
jgi:hypothetical protein